MDAYHLEATPLTPEVLLDPAKGLLVLRGESYPEHVLSFYAPVLERLRTALEGAMASRLQVEMHVTYFNSASAKALHRIFQQLNRAAEKGFDIELRWHYDEEDDLSRELSHDIREDFPALRVVDVPVIAA
jgi:hypothetical protein